MLLPTLRLPQRLRLHPRPRHRRPLPHRARRRQAEGVQRYVDDTNILETTFTTPSGVVTVTDFMPVSGDNDGDPSTPPPDPPHEIHRVVTCAAGRVEMRCEFRPRHDYARAVPEFRPLDARSGATALQARAAGQSLTLLADVSLPANSSGIDARFTLGEGQSATFVLVYGPGRFTSLARRATARRMQETADFWRGLVRRMDYDGLWRHQVVRSFLVLHLMMYPKTGAIVAAPTTSLPETLGGSRNWDYRFSWLRDSAFTVDILYRLGDEYGADRYINWLIEQCQLHSRRTRIVYGISPDSSLEEYTLDHLRGYEDSRPVRIGNAASEHLQLDVFGEVIISIHSLLLLHGDIPGVAWELVERLAETVMKSWKRRDRGVWEVRGEQQHFVYSKVMCWAGLDYAAYIAAATGHRNLYRRWSLAADNIKTEILEQGWSTSGSAPSANATAATPSTPRTSPSPSWASSSATTRASARTSTPSSASWPTAP